MSAISVKNLTKTFTQRARQEGFFNKLAHLFSADRKTIKAVDNVSFEIKEGELVGFIGPNGAGKSTTLKMLTGILFPTSGEITVLGHVPQKERVKLAFKIGTVFGQRQQLLYHLPAIDSFNLFSKIYELKKEAYQSRLKELVKLFELEPYLHTPVRKLSLGERMRCELVAALLHRPQVLFLDEPTIGMDIIAKKNLREYIRKLNHSENTTVILTSHDLDDIEELCPRVIVINKGKLVFDGSMERIRSRLQYKILELYLDKPLKSLPKLRNVKVLKHTNISVTLKVDRTKTPIRKVLDAYLRKASIDDILIEDPPIEEVIERLYRA